MYVLKIFHEEPAALGASFDGGESAEAFLSALGAAPRYVRLYLTGSVAPNEGHADATGLSALPEEAWKPALAKTLGLEHQTPSALDRLAPGAWHVLPESDRFDRSLTGALSSDDAPTRLAALRALLDAGCTVLHAEPAPDGFDLHVFAPHPLLDRFVAALPPARGDLRRFAAPYRSLRSEAKFYFERWGALPPPSGLVEV
ncbi:MAG: hypothetical protein LCH53_01075 [Bacteroidetes bacterium]|nr:hypothetical protein [Bacteroidota bacterium]